MSTRATYGFTDKSSHTKKHFVYIHHDGYLEGAAMYFYATLMNESKGCFATQFIRANEGAELTSSHDIHGDTEYKYDVTGSGPSAQIEAYKLLDRPVLQFSGKLHEFVTQYNEMIENFEPFKEIDHPYGGKQIVNLTLARKALKNPISHLKAWVGKYEGGANWNSCVEEANSILSVFPELLYDGVQELLSRKPALKV